MRGSILHFSPEPRLAIWLHFIMYCFSPFPLYYWLLTQIHFSNCGTFFLGPFHTPSLLLCADETDFFLLYDRIFTIVSYLDKIIGLFQKHIIHSLLFNEVLYFYPKLYHQVSYQWIFLSKIIYYKRALLSQVLYF